MSKPQGTGFDVWCVGAGHAGCEAAACGWCAVWEWRRYFYGKCG